MKEEVEVEVRGERRRRRRRNRVAEFRKFPRMNRSDEPKRNDRRIENATTTIRMSARLPSSVIPEDVHLVSKLFIVLFSSVTS